MHFRREPTQDFCHLQIQSPKTHSIPVSSALCKGFAPDVFLYPLVTTVKATTEMRIKTQKASGLHTNKATRGLAVFVTADEVMSLAGDAYKFRTR